MKLQDRFAIGTPAAGAHGELPPGMTCASDERAGICTAGVSHPRELNVSRGLPPNRPPEALAQNLIVLLRKRLVKPVAGC